MLYNLQFGFDYSSLGRNHLNFYSLAKIPDIRYLGFLR